MDAIPLQADEVLVKPMAVPTLVALIQEKLEKRGTRQATNVERVASILEREALATILLVSQLANVVPDRPISEH